MTQSDERRAKYSEHDDVISSARPNGPPAAEIAGLTPSSALDSGFDEGSDAICQTDR